MTRILQIADSMKLSPNQPQSDSKNRADASEPSSSPAPFISDIEGIRRRVSEEIDKGPLTPNYQGNAEQACVILNEALATEIVCTLRYTSHALLASGLQSHDVAQEFEEHAREEQRHALQIAERISQLGGVPDLNPDSVTRRSHAEFGTARDMIGMIRENLIAERIAVETYRDIVRYFSDHDPVSRRLMEEVLAKEEEHADDLTRLLTRLQPARSA